MYSIVICGDSDERILTKTIAGTCMRYGGVFVSDGKNIYETGEGTEFLILCADSESEISCGGILVVGSGIGGGYPVIKNKSIITVADTGDAERLSFLAGHEGVVIGCSMSHCDTVSLSCSTDCRIVSLRRELTTLDGDIIEPCEIAVRCSEDIPVYPLLASSCVLALCGVPYENGYDIYSDPT